MPSSSPNPNHNPHVNLMTMPPGTRCIVKLDDGRKVPAVTTGWPYMLGNGIYVVKSDATGAEGYNLARFEIVRMKEVADGE